MEDNINLEKNKTEDVIKDITLYFWNEETLVFEAEFKSNTINGVQVMEYKNTTTHRPLIIDNKVPKWNGKKWVNVPKIPIGTEYVILNNSGEIESKSCIKYLGEELPYKAVLWGEIQADFKYNHVKSTYVRKTVRDFWEENSDKIYYNVPVIFKSKILNKEISADEESLTVIQGLIAVGETTQYFCADGTSVEVSLEQLKLLHVEVMKMYSEFKRTKKKNKEEYSKILSLKVSDKDKIDIILNFGAQNG